MIYQKEIIIRIEKILSDIEKDISIREKFRKNSITDEKLDWVKFELRKIKYNIETGDLPDKDKRYPVLWRAISDTWPYDIDLSGEIIEIEGIYRKM